MGRSDLARCEVTVVGAGIGGLAVAGALAARGARVRVCEQAPALRAFGAGIQISPNGMAVLRALGLESAIAAQGVRAGAVELCEGLRDRVVLRMALDRPDRPYVFVHRGALIDTLARAAQDRGALLALGARIDGVDLSGSRARFTVNGAAHEADVLIGADGVHSRVRAAVEGPGKAAYTGQAAWRAIIAARDDEAPVATLAMGPGRHLVSYPLGQGLRNIVAVEERAAWTGDGWTHADDPARLRAAFAAFAPRFRAWLDRVDEVHIWGLFAHPVATRWHRGAGVVMGDAAHPTLPFLAQGANMALEDAWVLAEALSRDPPAAAFAAYRGAREARVRRIVAMAGANARNYHLSGPARAAAHLGLRMGSRLAPQMAARRFEWLYGHDVTRASLPGA